MRVDAYESSESKREGEILSNVRRRQPLAIGNYVTTVPPAVLLHTVTIQRFTVTENAVVYRVELLTGRLVYMCMCNSHWNICISSHAMKPRLVAFSASRYA